MSQQTREQWESERADAIRVIREYREAFMLPSDFDADFEISEIIGDMMSPILDKLTDGDEEWLADVVSQHEQLRADVHAGLVAWLASQGRAVP